MKLTAGTGAGATVFAGLSLLGAPAAQAHDHCQGHHGRPMAAAPAATRPGDNRPAAAAPAYDPDTVTTLRGMASAVTVVPAGPGPPGGIHVTVSSAGRGMEVHLGPAWFLESEGVTISEGDMLEVTGSVVGAGDGRFLVASDLKAGQRTVTLRDERGIPAWAGGPRR